MMVKKCYYSLEKEGSTASINIYGDIVSGEESAYNLSKQLETMNDVKEISIYINSYGGDVSEGLAIYNALKRHKAKVTTYCDGFACSIASVIFMAGDERIMNESSLLMIHNAWTYATGNAAELRKQADDLEKITQASIEAYKSHSSLSEDEIKKLMDAETWILPEEALSYGFATKVEKTEKEKASQNAFMKLFEIVKAYQAENPETDTEEDPDDTDPETDTETGTDTDDNSDTPEEEPDSDDEKEITDEETDEKDKRSNEETNQKWACFFKAILKT